MKTSHKTTFLAGVLLAVLAGGPAFGTTTIINDEYTVTGDNSTISGFILGEGINTEINPPTSTRLTGTAAASLGYLRTGNKGADAYTIDNNRAKMTQGAQSGRFTLSADETTPCDFAAALGASTATPANPVIYDVTVSMRNAGPAGERMTFAIGTVEAGGGSWSFGIQIVKSGTTYDIYKRIKKAASGLSAEVNALITTAGSATSLINFLIRVTDAGAETAGYHSRVQVSRNGGTTWIYDTAADATLVNGWRFEAAPRYFTWDQAPSTGAVYYDNFSANVYQMTWSGGGGDDSWSTSGNWGGYTPGTTLGEDIIFAGSTRLTPNMQAVYIVRKLQFSSGAGAFTIGAAEGMILTLNGDIFQNSANAQTLNTPIAIAATRTVNTASGNLTIGGAISGAGGIIKSGAETLTLGAANTYGGNTAVSAGRLLVNGSIGSGAVTVQNTAKLGGSGAIGGNITVESGGNLSPGDSSIGTLAANGNLTLNGSSTTSVEVDRSGPSSDSVTGIGTLTMGGTLEVANTGAALEAGDAFTLFSSTSKSGEFAAISPANPNSDEALAWDTLHLKDNGILRVHRSPNANNLNTSRGGGASLKIKLSDLFSSTDDDGDSVVLEQCKPSTRGASITADSTHIYYTLASNDNDDFDYVVTDNRGGKRTRKITISVADAFGPTQQITLVDGKPAVSFAGIPGARYDVQRATDVTFTQNLTTVLSTNAPAGGLFLLVEEPSLPEAYYRLKYPGTPAP